VPCQSIAGGGNDYEDGLPAGKIPGGDDGTGFAENEPKCVYAFDRRREKSWFKQIAGLIARRVVSWKKIGDKVARGERIGLVRIRVASGPCGFRKMLRFL